MQNSLTWLHVFAFCAIVFSGMWIYKRTHSKVSLAIVSIIMICVAGLRYGYIDTRAYRHSFLLHNRDIIFDVDFWLNDEIKDKGFAVVQSIIKFFTDDGQVFLFILSLITVGLLFYGIVKRVAQADLGIFLFITTGCYLDTMNGVRQYLVSAILFFFLPKLIEEKKFVKYLLLVLIMSTIHGSALLFIPIYFIAHKRAWSNSTLLLAIVGGFFYLFFNTGVGAALAEILEGTSYGDDYADMLLEGNASVNIIRVFVAAIPILLSLLNRDAEIKKTPLYTTAFNMSFINLMCWLFATRALYFYRLCMYFTPYMIVHLCLEIYAIKNKREKQIMTVLMIILYFAWFVYSLYISGDSFFVGYLKY